MSKNNDLVIVTPAWNSENSIRQTCMSVIAQSYSNWRMIVIDDVSSDNTSQKVNDLSNDLGLGKQSGSAGVLSR